MAADLMYNHCTLFANPLRPVVGVLRARKGRRFFEVLKKMMPGSYCMYIVHDNIVRTRCDDDASVLFCYY